MGVKPISPKDVTDNLDKIIPEAIITAVNNLIKKEFRGNDVLLHQDEIIREARKLDKTLTEDKIYNNNWLDFEPLFRKAGWDVKYYSPGYGDSGPSTYTFKPKK